MYVSSQPSEEGLSSITQGGLYVYIREIPRGCAGHIYRVHRFILDVPSYQHKVLVECLSGQDEGLWFTCSLDNFRVRYRLHDNGHQTDE